MLDNPSHAGKWHCTECNTWNQNVMIKCGWCGKGKPAPPAPPEPEEPINWPENDMISESDTSSPGNYILPSPLVETKVKPDPPTTRVIKETNIEPALVKIEMPARRDMLRTIQEYLIDASDNELHRLYRFLNI